MQQIRRIDGERTRQRILDTLAEYGERHRRPPTCREISTHSGISLGSLSRQLKRLETDGLISRQPGSRNITVIDGTPVPAREAAS